ncbi:MAG: ATP-dependent DNA helicase RecG, partial [Flavobacteriaceae bacterium]
MELVWFRGYQWLRESLRINQNYVIFGRLNWFKNTVSMPHPEMELERDFEQGVKASFYPIYPSTEKLVKKGISQRVIQKLVAHLIQSHSDHFSETLPFYLLDHFKLISKKQALIQVHYPTHQNILSKAQAR